MGFGRQHCVEAAQRVNACFLGDPVFVSSVSFLCCPILLTSALSLCFLLYSLPAEVTVVCWSLSEIDVVPSTYPWVFKGMTLITKVSLC